MFWYEYWTKKIDVSNSWLYGLTMFWRLELELDLETCKVLPWFTQVIKHNKNSYFPQNVIAQKIRENVAVDKKKYWINYLAVHKGGDGSSLVIVEALISFKTFVNVSLLAKSNNLTILERKTLSAASIPFDVLSSMNAAFLTSESLDRIKHDLESAIRLYQVKDYGEAAGNFMNIIRLFRQRTSLEMGGALKLPLFLWED